MIGAFKRFLIDKIAGAEIRAMRDRFHRLEAQHRETLSRLEQLLVTNKDASTGAVQRLRAEQKLWAQLQRIPELDLAAPTRSVIFIRHSYYHFYYLAAALRRRGWRAIAVSLEQPTGPNSQYYHGEDVNMWDADPMQFRANAEVVFEFSKSYFDLMHFAGDGTLSFFPWNFGEEFPEDIAEWKRMGKHVAYTISGCNSATAKSSVHAWSGLGTQGASICDNCPWQDRPDICDDAKNLAWGRKVHRYCDMIFSELQPSLDFLSSQYPNVVRGPATMVLDEKTWDPALEVPDAFKIAREPGEVLVYHAFGNYASRDTGTRNIKGTPAIVAAVDRLRAEGHRVRLMFFSRVPNELVRYYQAQADIVVDQLWAGSWGANGRESMMLGKPVVGFVNTVEHDPADVLQALATSPVVQATADTVYEVLKSLIVDPVRRAELGRRSREFAVHWHSATEGAVRYEDAYDRMIVRSLPVERLNESKAHESHSDFAA